MGLLDLSMQISRRAAALFELFPASTWARFIASHLGLQGLGNFALIDGTPVGEPVLVHVQNGVRYLKGQVCPHRRRLGEIVLIDREVFLSKQANGPEPFSSLRGRQQRLPVAICFYFSLRSMIYACNFCILGFILSNLASESSALSRAADS